MIAKVRNNNIQYNIQINLSITFNISILHLNLYKLHKNHLTNYLS